MRITMNNELEKTRKNILVAYLSTPSQHETGQTFTGWLGNLLGEAGLVVKSQYQDVMG
jgi:hypothetical protein